MRPHGITPLTEKQSPISGGGRAPARGLVNVCITGERLFRSSPEARHALVEAGKTPGAVVVALPGGLRMYRHGPGPDAKIGGGKRGQVTGFSRASQARMMQRMMGVEWGRGPVLFVTLTYHESFGLDCEQWKAHLWAWRRRLEYHWKARGYLACVWRLELQCRKSGEHAGQVAPHFHLALFWKRAPDLARFRAWLAESWNTIAEPGDEKHLAAGTQALRARNTKGQRVGQLMHYLTKYLGKVQPQAMVDGETGEIMPTGRIWGVWGQPPTAFGGAVILSQAAFEAMTVNINAWGQRVGSWYLGAISPQWRGFSIMGDGPGLLDVVLAGISEGIEYR